MFNKNVNNKDLVKSLNESIRRNCNALDYVENEISRNKDLINYNQENLVAKNNLKNLEHIKFCLSFLTDSFNKTLRGLV